MDKKDIYLSINSENGEISLNDLDLVMVNSIDIHMKTGEFTNVVIDMDTKKESITALIEGNVKWLNKIDPEKKSGV